MDVSMVLIVGLVTVRLKEQLRDFGLVHYSLDEMWVEMRACQLVASMVVLLVVSLVLGVVFDLVKRWVVARAEMLAKPVVSP